MSHAQETVRQETADADVIYETEISFFPYIFWRAKIPFPIVLCNGSVLFAFTHIMGTTEYVKSAWLFIF